MQRKTQATDTRLNRNASLSSFDTESDPLNPSSPSRTPPQRREVSLFWRTFFLLALLLLGCFMAWLQTFRALEFGPRSLQRAQQLASLVNLSRTVLNNADPITRQSLIKAIADEEGVHIEQREPSDTYHSFNKTALDRQTTQLLKTRLGSATIVASEVNKKTGLWIGLEVNRTPYWLQIDPSRIQPVAATTWLIWLVTATLISLAGAVLIARLINQPLQSLSYATNRVRNGDFNAGHLNEKVATSEIRQVNIGFNRMAQQLSHIEQDRALMLAGISHDLRTPLARLRLETEMSVTDLEARKHMSADIEQVTAIIDKFLDYARPDHMMSAPVSVNKIISAAIFALGDPPDVDITCRMAENIFVMGDAVELRRVFSNMLENARRYGKDPVTEVARIAIAVKVKDDSVLIKLRDHGRGVNPNLLAQLTQPFFRVDASRSSATGTGLGLAIVERAITRMGGRFALINISTGGLSSIMELPIAKPT